MSLELINIHISIWEQSEQEERVTLGLAMKRILELLDLREQLIK